MDQRTIGIGNPGRSIQHGWLAEDADHPAAPLKHMRHGRGKLHQLLQQQHLIPVLMPELLLRQHCLQNTVHSTGTTTS